MCKRVYLQYFFTLYQDLAAELLAEQVHPGYKVIVNYILISTICMTLNDIAGQSMYM